jgi:hypothetical protein
MLQSNHVGRSVSSDREFRRTRGNRGISWLEREVHGASDVERVPLALRLVTVLLPILLLLATPTLARAQPTPPALEVPPPTALVHLEASADVLLESRPSPDAARFPAVFEGHEDRVDADRAAPGTVNGAS